MYEYEQDLREVNRLRRVINDLRDDLDTMVRNRDRGREVRPGRLKKLIYYAMRDLSNTYISGVAVEAMRLEDVLGPADLDIAERSPR